MSYDIYLVGVGGQGILTLADLIMRAAVHKGHPVSFFPTKGMAQRGGVVKAELRLGRAGVDHTSVRVGLMLCLPWSALKR